MINFQKPKRRVNKVFIHCSATDNAEHDNTEFIRSIHVDQNGWSDIGYHFFITKQGVVHACRHLEYVPAAQKGHNTGSIAICLSGLDQFTAAQMEALVALCQDIQDQYAQRLVFKGHREVANKLCPNFDYRYVLNLTDQGYLRQPRKSLADSREVKGGKVAGVATILGGVADSVDLPAIASNVSAGTSIARGLTFFAEMSPFLLGGVAIVAIGYILYARYDDHKDGLR
jgi:hypothetical protein